MSGYSLEVVQRQKHNLKPLSAGEGPLISSGRSQGNVAELGSRRVKLGSLMVFAPFIILGSSLKTALEKRCSLSCRDLEFRERGVWAS